MSRRRQAFWLLAALGFVTSFSTMAGDRGAPVANSIGAVWDLAAQPCNGGGVNAMTRDPDQARIQKSKVVDLPQLGVSFQVPRFPDVQSIYIKIFMGDRSRGVIDNYVLFADHDLAPPVGALVITELPVQFDTNDKVFAAVETLEGQLSAKAGVTPDFKRISGPYGEAIEMLVKSRVGTDCFPTSSFRLAASESQAKTIGISRFVFTMGKLVEFALIVSVPDEVKPDAAQAFAEKVMDGYWLGLKPLRPSRESSRSIED
jgi:hypothetical protein